MTRTSQEVFHSKMFAKRCTFSFYLDVQTPRRIEKHVVCGVAIYPSANLRTHYFYLTSGDRKTLYWWLSKLPCVSEYHDRSMCCHSISTKMHWFCCYPMMRNVHFRVLSFLALPFNHNKKVRRPWISMSFIARRAGKPTWSLSSSWGKSSSRGRPLHWLATLVCLIGRKHMYNELLWVARCCVESSHFARWERERLSPSNCVPRWGKKLPEISKAHNVKDAPQHRTWFERRTRYWMKCLAERE